MAESDSFIQEVSEEVRRDKMYAVWRRYGPIVIGVIVIAVLFAAGKGWREGQVEARKAELGGALLAADAIDDPAEASAAFLALAEEGEYDYPVVARLRAGAALMQAGQLDESQAQYEAIQAIPDVDPRFSDLAELRIVMMRSGTMDPDEMLDRLGPLTTNASVWRLPALEFEAAAYMRKDEPESAVASLRSILEIPQLSAATQGRVQELIEAVEETVDRAEPAAPAVQPEPTEAPETPAEDAEAAEDGATGEDAATTGDAAESADAEETAEEGAEQ